MDRQELERIFNESYELYGDDIFRHCFFRLSDRERAKDATADTFTRVWEYMQGGEVIKNIRALLYKVATNIIIDQYRKKKSASLDAMTEDGYDPEERSGARADLSAEINHLLRVMEEIPETYRDAVIMRHVDDLSPQDIALILGESENVVSVRINRGLKMLRERLQVETK